MRTHHAGAFHAMAQVTDLASAMTEAGMGDNLRKYMQARGVNTAAVMAAINETPKKVDAVLLDPLEKGFKFADNHTLKLSAMEIPVVKARLRHVWRACDRLVNGAAGGRCCCGGNSSCAL